MSVEAYFLVGPTASGKSEVAHLLARRMSLPILSIDSMQVYRDLDVGTAKPSPEERAGLAYFGLDIVAPNEDFSVADFHNYADMVLRGISTAVIVCGGTGLYSKVLIEGMGDGPEPDAELRAKWERAVAEGKIKMLQQELSEASPEVFDSLKDKENPRRLIRALERVRAGSSLAKGWGNADAVMTGLEVSPDELRARIDHRAERMFREGLVAETRRALEKYGQLSRTASQAIGYLEALTVMSGQATEAHAVDKVKARTRRLAKKQRTWFRNQSRLDWVPAGKRCDIEELADRVEASWKKNGAVKLSFEEKR